MNHLDFLIWMLGMPLIETITHAIRWQWCERREYSPDTRGWAALLEFIFYIYVGFLLWNGE